MCRSVSWLVPCRNVFLGVVPLATIALEIAGHWLRATTAHGVAGGGGLGSAPHQRHFLQRSHKLKSQIAGEFNLLIIVRESPLARTLHIQKADLYVHGDGEGD